MNMTKLYNGGWQVAAMFDGFLVSRTYYGYTKREACAQFRNERRAVLRERRGFSSGAQS